MDLCWSGALGNAAPPRIADTSPPTWEQLMGTSILVIFIVLIGLAVVIGL